MITEPFFDGTTWNRDAVLSAQNQRAQEAAEMWGSSASQRDLLTAPLAAAFVEKFEMIHSVKLPQEYRSFLLQVGDGGSAPGLYMRPLGAPKYDSHPWEPGEIYQSPDDPNSQLHKVFSYEDSYDVTPQMATNETTPGALFLFDYGSAMWDLLIVNGPCAGQIWSDRIADCGGLSPRRSIDGERLSFARYYCLWLSEQLPN